MDADLGPGMEAPNRGLDSGFEVWAPEWISGPWLEILGPGCWSGSWDGGLDHTRSSGPGSRSGTSIDDWILCLRSGVRNGHVGLVGFFVF